MHERGDAADQFDAYIGQNRHWRNHEGVQTHVAHHFLSPLHSQGIVTHEPWQLLIPGD